MTIELTAAFPVSKRISIQEYLVTCTVEDCSVINLI